MKRTAITVAISALCAGLAGGALAQQQEQQFSNADSDSNGFLNQEEARTAANLDQDTFNQADANGDGRLDVDEFLVVVERTGGQQEQQQNSQQQQSSQQQGSQVNVDEKPADVDVQTQAPDVTVEKQKPDVTVEQPKPEVQVTQPKPDVEVQQAEPNVSVQQQGQPEVEIEEAGKAQVDVVRPEDQQQDQQGQQNQQDQQSQQQQSGSNSLMSMQASDLEGKTVVNQNGQEIGDIDRIAQHTQNNRLYGIVTVGGFWGIGGEEIALPLEEMQLENDQLIMQTNRGEDEIKQSAESYNESDYRELESDQTLSEATQSQ